MPSELNTVLKDRILWYDGVNQVAANQVADLLLSGVPIDKIIVNSISDELQQYNCLVELPISVTRIAPVELDWAWQVPELPCELDEYLIKLLDTLEMSSSDSQKYQDRLAEELSEIKRLELVNLFRSIIYVVDTFRREGIVWGVGRGSSCASLALFLIGIHSVDPVRYDIPLTEFFH